MQIYWGKLFFSFYEHAVANIYLKILCILISFSIKYHLTACGITIQGIFTDVSRLLLEKAYYLST